MKTRVICIIDVSGSMEPLTKDTIGGYNRFLLEQQASGEPTDEWTLIVFNHDTKVLCEGELIGNAPKLDNQNYSPSGSTALLDAMGEALEGIPELDDDERVVCLVQTDGEENASSKYTYDNIRALVEAREGTGGWTFVFMGTGLDAFDVYSSLSNQPIHANVVSYAASGAAVGASWEATSKSMTATRTGDKRSAKAFYGNTGTGDKEGINAE
jgi:Mg-chelatase subunit ChlD